MKHPSSLFAAAVGSCVLIWTGQAAHGAGEEIKFQSRSGHHTSLIELYTSEGCSSCPPAETWLSKLVTSPQLWTEIVPVAFHVDYWDNLGWRDRFASPQGTARQRTYAANWGRDSVYTPGFVYDGREWRPGATADGNAASDRTGGQLSAVVQDGKRVQVVYRPNDRATVARTVSVALLGCDLTSRVKAGENSGRSLKHDFVALDFQTKPLAADKSGPAATFDLPAAAEDVKRLALAVWVEESGRAGIQQAVGGWLPEKAPK